MKKTTLILIVWSAVFLNACGGGSGEPAPETSSGTNTTTEIKKEDTKQEETAKKDEIASTESSEGVTGVAACDEYLSKVEKFLENDNVPQQVRDSYKKSLEQNRTAWKQAASNPQTKATLESSCKTALDSMKTVMDQYGG